MKYIIQIFIFLCVCSTAQAECVTEWVDHDYNPGTAMKQRQVCTQTQIQRQPPLDYSRAMNMPPPLTVMQGVEAGIRMRQLDDSRARTAQGLPQWLP